MNHFNHRSVKPNRVLNVVLNAAAFANFADNARSVHVAGFKRVNVNLAVLVDELGAQRADFFRYELSKNLSRVSGSCRVVLQAVLVEQLCARAVGDYKAVGCGAVVV